MQRGDGGAAGAAGALLAVSEAGERGVTIGGFSGGGGLKGSGRRHGNTGRRR